MPAAHPAAIVWHLSSAILEFLLIFQNIRNKESAMYSFVNSLFRSPSSVVGQRNSVLGDFELDDC